MSKPKPPKHFNSEGKRMWSETIETCGELDATQLSLLQGMCEMWERKESLRADIAATGNYIVDRWGQMKPNPLLDKEAAAHRGYRDYYYRLGLDQGE